MIAAWGYFIMGMSYKKINTEITESTEFLFFFVNSVCSVVKQTKTYTFTAANPNPFGPTCVPITVVTLTIKISRGIDWLTVSINSFNN